jgi:UDP-N-acetylmuramate: L-alanyl-gamma-D-glutamyl-meso-diaminopimelate ligase
LLGEEERLSPDRVLQTIRSAGRKAEGIETASEIAEFLATETRPGDMVLVMSNGSFDGLCAKLLKKLQERVAMTGKLNG